MLTSLRLMQKDKANVYNVNMAYCSLTKAMVFLDKITLGIPGTSSYDCCKFGKWQFFIYTTDIMVLMQSAEDSLVQSIITVKSTTSSEVHIVYYQSIMTLGTRAQMLENLTACMNML